MSQAEMVGDLDHSVGYVLKQAASALRGAMEAALRPQGLTVPQYACLELLGRHPEQSNAELARGAFVTRQSMNEVLRGLQRRDLVTRPAAPQGGGRARPARLTAAGRRALDTASVTVADVERQMLAGRSPDQQEWLLDALTSCRDSLGTPPPPPDA